MMTRSKLSTGAAMPFNRRELLKGLLTGAAALAAAPLVAHARVTEDEWKRTRPPLGAEPGQQRWPRTADELAYGRRVKDHAYMPGDSRRYSLDEFDERVLRPAIEAIGRQLDHDIEQCYRAAR